MYNIGDIFYEDEHYADRAMWCGENNATIEEIEPDEQGRRFKIVAIPQPSARDLAEYEIAELKQRLAETDYAVIKIAEGAATAEEYADVIEERKRARERINELEQSISG